MKPAVIESMTRIMAGNMVVRVWVNEDELQEDYPKTRERLKNALVRFRGPRTNEEAFDGNKTAIAMCLLDLYDVNAVEVTQPGSEPNPGDGIILYKQWP